jgi:hypothetical protein
MLDVLATLGGALCALLLTDDDVYAYLALVVRRG